MTQLTRDTLSQHLNKIDSALVDGTDSAVDLAPMMSPDVLLGLVELVLALDAGDRALTSLQKAALQTTLSLAKAASERREAMVSAHQGIVEIRAALQPETNDITPHFSPSDIGKTQS